MPRNETTRQAGKRPLRALTPQEKIDAINRVHNGESKAAVARDIGVPESTLRGWCKAEQKILTQLSNMKASGTSGYEQILTSSSENSNGAGSSSRSTPTTQTTMLGLGSASGVAEKADEFEAGPAHKRLKIESSTANNTMSNNILTSARIPMTNESLLSSHYFFNQLMTQINSTVETNNTLNFLARFMKSDLTLPYSGYSSTSNLLTAESLLSRNNGAMTNTTTMNTKQQPYQQLQTNNTLFNGNKRKYNAPGLTSTADISRVSSRRQNSQSPNAEKSSGITSQPMNNLLSPMPSTSANSESVANTSHPKSSSRNGKRLNTIICNLQQQHMSPAPMCNIKEEIITNNVMNNNNNNVDHVDNENRRYPDTLPPGFSEMVTYCTKLIDWLHIHGTPICTYTQINQIKSILANMTNWANKKEIEPPQKTNGTS